MKKDKIYSVRYRRVFERLRLQGFCCIKTLLQTTESKRRPCGEVILCKGGAILYN